jgi:hypothetical protein
MYVDHASRIIYFHNPKTGGISVIDALSFEQDSYYKLNHLLPSEAKRCIFQGSWSEYYKFSFVRNPWDRLVSLYEYHRSVRYAIFEKMNNSHVIARSYSFEDWLDVNLSGLRRSNHFGVPQSKWHDGVDEVFKFEDFEQSISKIASKMGKTPKSSHMNSSARLPYREYYTRRASIEAVKRLDAEVIERYGYTF